MTPSPSMAAALCCALQLHSCQTVAESKGQKTYYLLRMFDIHNNIISSSHYLQAPVALLMSDSCWPACRFVLICTDDLMIGGELVSKEILTAGTEAPSESGDEVPENSLSK